MSDLERWRALSPDAIRAHAAGRERVADVALSEAAQRAALALRHGSTTPAMLALLAQLAEGFALSLAAWAGWLAGGLAPSDPVAALGVALALAALSIALAAACGAYALRRLRAFLPGAITLALAWSALCALATLALWAQSGRVAGVEALWLIGLAALWPARAAVAMVVDWCLRAGLTERRAVLVGGGGGAERLIRGLEANPANDIRICGIFDDRDDDRSPPLVAGARKLGGVAELIEFARVAHVDMLIVTLPLSAETRILTLLSQLWVLPVDIRLSVYAADYEFPRREAGVPADGGLVGVVRRPLDGGRRVAKRALDIIVASVALLALWPLMLATAVAIRLGSRGPALFRQMRHGYNHVPVEVWKFRSMYVEQADPTARKVVTRGDPRVTRVGRFIRKTSIDELPQLLNVLQGGLSLVGPRPHVLNAVSSRAQTFAEIVRGYSGRHRVPPGITGWAQINGWRGEIDDPEKLRQRFEHDLYYIENWSLWLDLKILALTPFRLFGSDAAY